MIKSRLLLWLLFVAALCGAAIAPAAAHTQTIDHGGTYFGSVVVEPDQEVDGSVTVIGGNATIEGRVDGSVTAIGGHIDERDGAVIEGKKTEIGETGSSIAPWLPGMGASSMVAHENRKLISLLAYSVIVVLAFLIFPVRVRLALDRAEQHPGISFALGVVAIIASAPIFFLLLVSFIGWPLIPLEIVAYIAGIIVGQAALGLLIGRRLFELVRPHGTPSPLGALILGLVIIAAAEVLPVVGWMVTALVWLVGLGAAILAFFPPIASGPRTFAGPAGSAGPRPTISGPPMNTG